MATPQLDVYLPDGSVQNFPLTGEKVVVGTATSCDIILDRAEVAPNHLLLSPRPDACWVAVARGVATPTLVDGQPFDRGMVAWGKSVVIGPLRLVLNDGTRATKKSGGAADGEEKVSPVLLIAAAVIIPVALYSMLAAPPGASAPDRVRAPPPALFDSLQRPCPQTDPAAYRGAAEESSRVALSKAERMPFHMQDGVEAVIYYAQTSACYRAAGDAPAADTAMRQATLLQARLEDEYRAHQFRLERALEQERILDALYEVRMLSAMVAHRRGPYLTALNTLERQLTLRIDTTAAAAH